MRALPLHTTLGVCVASIATATGLACGACGSESSAPSAPSPLGDGGAAGGGGGLPDTGAPLPSCDPGKATVAFTIDATKDERAISPYVYGTNLAGAWGDKAKHLTLARQGGNRWTAYDWETNASNAGSDYNYENDGYLGGGNVAGEAVRSFVAANMAAGAASLVTIPIQGWVAGDESGPLNPQETNLSLHFKQTSFAKGGALAYPPDTTDAMVYEDEFVAFLEGKFPTAHTDPARTLFYSLDNEPDLWATTHAEIQKSPVTYADLVAKNVAAATAVKKIAPKAKVFGPVDYGWSGYVNLQAAPDNQGRDWLDFYLDQMKAAEQTSGVRLVDVLDLHWYPEATGGGVRIIDEGTSPSAALVEARVQAPRSLWDPSYVENSWITSGKTPIDLIHAMKAKIAQHYPGTELSFSEYSYGGEATISGAVAQADVLGIFGREGVFAATQWPLSNAVDSVYAAFATFRNYDGNGGSFGDTSVSATTSDVAKTSIYASVDSTTPGRMVLVAINKTSAAIDASFRVAYGAALTHAEAFQLTSGAPKPVSATAPIPNCQSFVTSLPAMSVTTLVLH